MAGGHVVETSPRKLDAFAITRPAPVLMRYYMLVALLSGPFFPITIVPLFFRYETLRYKFDESGISMSWGILFRREIHLTYRRIQDIHLSRNVIQRWMGLAVVSVQTASGSAGPEMSIEGVLEADELRDFLYTKMRGAHGEAHAKTASDDASGHVPAASGSDEALGLLREIRDMVNALAARNLPHE